MFLRHTYSTFFKDLVHALYRQMFFLFFHLKILFSEGKTYLASKETILPFGPSVGK